MRLRPTSSAFDTKGDVITLYGSAQMVLGLPSEPTPLATVELSPQTFILSGDKHPPKGESLPLVE